ncbi:MAG: methyl-accepting chemotaxis protein [Desulfobulbaceae bacterium]|nr:methyl-accepting chemotaxis protein [Desulfobulbaceae bacterium]
MTIKDIKIGRKLGLGFGIILALLVIIGVFSYSMLKGIDHSSHETLELAQKNEFILEKNVDHLKWLNTLNGLVFNDEIHSVELQTDDHQCSLGKWLYGEEAKQLAQGNKELAGLLEAIKEPHRRLHESAGTIIGQYIDFDVSIDGILAERWIDHLVWLNSLNHSLMTGENFTGGLDPDQCAFGKWYHSHKPADPKFEELLKTWEAPHATLHLSARKIVDLMAKGKQDRAKAVFNSETMQALKELSACYENTMGWIDHSIENKKALIETYQSNTLPALTGTQKILHKILDFFHHESDTASELMKSKINQTTLVTMILSAIAVILGVAAAIVITRGITAPIGKTIQVLGAMDKGDFSKRLELDSKDEIGEMAQSLNHVAESLSSMIRDINAEVSTLESSASEMSGVAAQMTSSSEETVAKANTMAAAAEEMTGNMDSIAAAMEESTSNVNAVAAATEEMSSNIGDISRRATEANENTREAVDKAGASVEMISELGQATEEIGMVTETIAAISDKTNLLALNATIEAARAGEAGKGFAVVASEIKDLAQQTAEATTDISGRLKGIQSSTAGSVTGINEIADVIRQVDETVAAISESMEQQNNATTEISGNVSQTSQGLKEINENAAQTSQAAAQVATEVSAVNDSANEISNSSAMVQQNASALSELAGKLKEMVGKFKV